MSKPQWAQFLTYSGSVPFLGAVLAKYFGVDILGVNADLLIYTYGAVIASFIAGIHWAVYLFRDFKSNLFVHSNIVALVAWSVPLLHIPAGSLLLVLCFGYLLYIDRQLVANGIWEKWYYRMRVKITGIVSVALLAHFLISM